MQTAATMIKFSNLRNKIWRHFSRECLTLCTPVGNYHIYGIKNKYAGINRL